MNDFRDAIRRVNQSFPLPKSWGVKHQHDSQPSNAAAWRKHLRDAKANAATPDIAPAKKLRVVKSKPQKRAANQ